MLILIVCVYKTILTYKAFTIFIPVPGLYNTENRKAFIIRPFKGFMLLQRLNIDVSFKFFCGFFLLCLRLSVYNPKLGFTLMGEALIIQKEDAANGVMAGNNAVSVRICRRRLDFRVHYVQER